MTDHITKTSNKKYISDKFILDMVHHNPGCESYDSLFLDPNKLAETGYTGQVIHAHVHAGVMLDSCETDIFLPGSKERIWVENYALKIDKKIAEVKKAGLQCFAFTDLIVLPRNLISKLKDQIQCPEKVADALGIKGEFSPDVHSEKTQQIVGLLIDEIFERFPGLDGLVVRVGETYLHEIPYHTGGDPITQGVQSHVELLNILRKSVCEKNNKTLIYRTWKSGIDEDAKLYQNVCSLIEPHPKLIFSIKHCIDDFHRSHPFSAPLGHGIHPQIVEVQCSREYEGKGAYPNYIAQGVIDGFEEYQHIMKDDAPKGLRDIQSHQNFAGLWTWARGGGWDGPYIENEFWCAMNAFVLVKWTQSPERSEQAIFCEFAELHGFDHSASDILYHIARMSAEAVLRGIASLKGGVNTWWTRDHYIGGVEDTASPMGQAVDQIIHDGRVEEIISERAQSVLLWRKIEELANQLENPNRELLDFIRVSCSYGLICFEVFAAGWTIMLLGKSGDTAGSYDAARMEKAIRNYDSAWSEWKALKNKHPNCPTLYMDTYCHYVQDNGMIPATGIGDSVARFRKALKLDAALSKKPY